jgi:hypothetical protein
VDTDDERQARADEESYGALFDRFAGLYLQCTSWQSFRKIFDCGQIIANTGQFKVSYSQTLRSYCYREGFVPIFDFVSPGRRDILRHASNWGSFLYGGGGKLFGVAMEIDKEWVEQRVIRASEVTEPFVEGMTAYRCPVVEAWIRESIPFSVVSTVRLIASEHPIEVIGPPITLDRLEDARVDLTRKIREQRSPVAGLGLRLRLLDRKGRGRPRS